MCVRLSVRKFAWPELYTTLVVLVSIEIILGFNDQAQSLGSMIRFDVQERELKHWQANTTAQCPSSMY